MALDKIRVTGGTPLHGEIQISGAKNATLPLLCLALLTDEPCRLTNVPNLHDVETMLNILRSLGVKVQRTGNTVEIQANDLTKTEAPYDFVRKMRASVLLLGPLLARFGFAKVSLPGGCAIGVRPIDQHLKAFEAIGATILLKEGYVEASGKKLQSNRFRFDLVTVTGTINALVAASRTEGVTTFENCACEPEVVACAEALRQMGAEVKGEGTTTLSIKGAKKLRGFELTMIPDRIETGTYMVAASITQGELFLRGAKAQDLQAVITKLRETGMEIQEDQKGIRVKGKRPIQPVHIETAPHPGFPTDMQAQLMVLLCFAEGNSTVLETIFENRFMHAAELNRMGAHIKIDNSLALIEGVKKLVGAPVMATDLRASASLVLAGLVAEGVTDVLRIYHLDRGYENMEKKLKSVGAVIERVLETNKG